MEEGRVEYGPVASPALGPPGPSKREKKVSRSLVKLPQKIEISSPPATFQKRSLVEDPCFASAVTSRASRGKSRRRWRHRRAASVFQTAFPYGEFAALMFHCFFLCFRIFELPCFFHFYEFDV